MGDTKKRITLKSFRSCKFDSLKYYGYCIMMLNSPMQNRKLGVKEHLFVNAIFVNTCIHIYCLHFTVSFFLLITMWEKEKRKSELPHLLFNYLFSSITTDFRRLH